MKNIKLSDMIAALSTLTMDELRELNEATRDQFNIISKKQAKKFSVGQDVKFFSTRSNRYVTGYVVKVNTKNVKVAAEGMTWIVSGSLLEAA